MTTARSARLRARLLALAGAAFLLAACQPGPSASPSATRTQAPRPTPVGSFPARTPDPDASPVPGASMADALRDEVDPAAILADLEHLEEIAAANKGHRAAGSAGYDASAAFVADELRKAGYEVELQQVMVPAFEQRSASVLEVHASGAAPAFQDGRDFKAMLFSASADVTAQVYRLGFDDHAAPGSRDGLGCEAADWAGVPEGVIVLVQPGNCRRHDVAVNGANAGAVAVVTAYPEWVQDHVLRPTLVTPEDIDIPMLGATAAVGLALSQASADGSEVRIMVDATFQRRNSPNVIAELPGGDASHVVMLGGHLDSVIDGPGINDNGSGTMTVLEIARALARVTADGGATPGWKVRVGFFTAEEIGLVGSLDYLGGASARPLEELEAYLNFDMVGSPNGVRDVYDGATTSRPTESGIISGLFATALEQDGLVWQALQVGSTDNVPFDQFGVPSGGLFSGANEVKSVAQASLFGGTADQPNDACYHLACDTTDNIDGTLLGQLARAAGWVVGALASGEVALQPGT